MEISKLHYSCLAFTFRSYNDIRLIASILLGDACCCYAFATVYNFIKIKNNKKKP